MSKAGPARSRSFYTYLTADVSSCPRHRFLHRRGGMRESFCNPVNPQGYPLPGFLRGHVSGATYRRWLQRKAAAIVRRDRRRGNKGAKVAAYKRAIHEAVVCGGDRDAYTGQPLRWDLISKYDNEASRRGGRHYKQRFGDLPSIDHIDEGRGRPRFLVCAWRTNDAKSDLSYEEFVALCRSVLRHHGTTGRRRKLR